MSFKQLYDDDERYLPEAFEMHKKAYLALNPVMQEYREKGYRVRDLSALIQRVIQDMETDLIL